MKNKSQVFTKLSPDPVMAAPMLGDVSDAQARESFSWLDKFIQNHFSSASKTPVFGPWENGQLVKQAGCLPEDGCGMDKALSFFEQEIAPGLLRWNHPRFAAYFATSAPIPAIVAESLVAAFNSNAMLTSASPAATELMQIVGKWYQSLLHVPRNLAPQFYTSASQSHQHALAMAISCKTEGRARRLGIAGEPSFRIYTSEFGHFFAEKNAVAASLGTDSVRRVPVDDSGSMRTDALVDMIEHDQQRGLKPLQVIATVGTTSITSVDPVREIAQIASRYLIHAYVDAAYAGAFACLPEYRWITDGWDLVDALCINPHKTLFVPQGCSLLFLRDRQALRGVCDHRAEYLPESNVGEGDPMDYTFCCGMRVPALASFLNFKVFGANGIRARVRHLAELSQFAVQNIAADHRFVLLTKQPLFSVICFRLKCFGNRTQDEMDATIACVCHKIQAAGQCWISKTQYQNQAWFRLAIGNINTTQQDVEFILNEIRNIC